MTDGVSVETKFYLDKIVTQIESANLQAAAELALAVEGEAKLNIQTNEQIDTGFMVNSVFTITPNSSGYSAAKGAAEAKNPDLVMAPEPTMEDGALAGVAVGAEYAIYQEEKKPFLYPAAETVAQKAGATIARVLNEMVSDGAGGFTATGKQVIK